MATALRTTTFTGVKVRSAVVARPAPAICTRIVALRPMEGKVVSDGMDKTVSVLVERYRENSKYGVRSKVSKKYHCHDENNECEVGDLVEISSIAPMSKTKSFKVDRIIRKVVKL